MLFPSVSSCHCYSCSLSTFPLRPAKNASNNATGSPPHKQFNTLQSAYKFACFCPPLCCRNGIWSCTERVEERVDGGEELMESGDGWTRNELGHCVCGGTGVQRCVCICKSFGRLGSQVVPLKKIQTYTKRNKCLVIYHFLVFKIIII